MKLFILILLAALNSTPNFSLAETVAIPIPQEHIEVIRNSNLARLAYSDGVSALRKDSSAGTSPLATEVFKGLKNIKCSYSGVLSDQEMISGCSEDWELTGYLYKREQLETYEAVEYANINDPHLQNILKIGGFHSKRFVSYTDLNSCDFNGYFYDVLTVLLDRKELYIEFTGTFTGTKCENGSTSNGKAIRKFKTIDRSFVVNWASQSYKLRSLETADAKSCQVQGANVDCKELIHLFGDKLPPILPAQ